jgi:PhnB protein
MSEAHKPTFSGVIPHLAVKGGTEAIAFYVKALGAELVQQMPTPDGRLMHAHLRLNGAPIFLHDDFDGAGGCRSPTEIGGASVTMHVALKAPAEVDALFERACAAGADVVMTPNDVFWGDRYARLRDPFGHVWSLGAPLSAG